MLKTTTARLAVALLGYVTLIILLLTLNPFYLTFPAQYRFSLYITPGDVIANVMLFLPIGFLFRLTRYRHGAILLGAVISAGIETMQLFMPARTPSVMDFLANTLGSGMGAWIYGLLSTRFAVTPGMLGRLRLETPLMSFVYLLIPLLWAGGFSLAESLDRWMLMVLIGMCGAIVFNDVYRYWLGGLGFRLTMYAALSAGVWFFLGAGPSLLHPLPILWIGVGIILFTAILTLIPRRFTDRRFERATLQRLLPVFALYLALLVLWPVDRPLGAWHGIFGLTDRIQDTSLQLIYPRIEHLVAFTVLGYLTAEWHGRSELPLQQDMPRLLAVIAGSVITLEVLAGFQAGSGASFIRAVMAILSALFGGSIYHLLRAHIRFLLAR